ncbi:unnamed protein product [Linum tenue]|uniref:Uncharacterized protein n=2 Tax=Linum tenue TaxID=586396 RepID=A0AAV0KSI3_9ROSI|nr:unnamed protein product [Linum tenue]
MMIKKKKISCKRRKQATAAGIRRPLVVERRVGALKTLIPNCESMGIEGLYRETAEYVLGLEMMVKLMQAMVQLLTPHTCASHIN